MEGSRRISDQGESYSIYKNTKLTILEYHVIPSDCDYTFFVTKILKTEEVACHAYSVKNEILRNFQ